MTIPANRQEIQKVYVNENGFAVIKCPSCDAVKNFNGAKFKGKKHILNVKCSCQLFFSIRLEFRKFYRKATKLSGDYILLPEKINRGRMTVVNVSTGGVGLRIMAAHRLVPGQEIQVIFSLDDKQRSVIDRPVVIMSVEKDIVCCEFTGKSSHDRALGFYLMV